MGAEAAEERWAARLRGFGPVGILVIAVISFAGTAFFGALLVLLWARISHTPLRKIGYVAPPSWTGTFVGGTIVGVAFKLVMKAVVMPLLGTAPVNQTYHYLVGDLPATAFMAFFVTVSGGFGEETVYRGFLFERFCKLFRSRSAAKSLALVLTSIWFAAVHYPDQGAAGAEQAVITGLAFGTMFLLTGSLALPMVTHAAFDLTAIVLIYWDLESRIAHLVFR
jgi:membrane protease YdiL (CAAX protease family)